MSEAALVPDPELLDRFARAAARAIGVPAALLYVADGERALATGAAGVTNAASSAAEAVAPLAARVISTGAPITLEDAAPRAAEGAPEAAAMLTAGARSCVGVPLVGRSNRVVGALVGLAPEARRWTTDDVDTMRDLAAAAADVVERETEIASVTRRQERLERALQELETDFSAGFQQSPVGMAIWSVHAGLVRANPALCAMLGASEAELLGRTLPEITHPDDAAKMTEALDVLLRGERDPVTIEQRCLMRDGSEVWVVLSISCVRDPEGRPHHLISQMQNISKRKAAEAALRESEERYRELVTSAREVIFETDAEGNWTFLNSAWTDLTGSAVDEVIGTSFLAAIHPDDRNPTVERFHTLLDGLVNETRFEARWLRADGATRWFEVSARSKRDEFGDTTGMAGTLADITERRTLAEQLRQAQKMEAVGRLAGGVAHDFNNMLTAIRGYSNLLMEELHPSDTRRADVEEIRRAADRAASLTRQLLAFSRKQVLSPVVLDLNDVVLDMEKMLRRIIGVDIDLEVSLATSAPIKADPGQLEQVLMNLCVNAADAMPDGGQLTIETQEVEIGERYVDQQIAVDPGRYIMLAVSDTGVGMDAETQSQIFEPFFTTKERGKGTGLGLSTVYGIVRQSGGHVWVYSERGRGSTFKIFLPRAGDIPKTEGAVIDEPIRGGSETVLLVEDEQALRFLMRRVLEGHGYSVLDARDGLEALRIGEQYPGPIHMVVSDVVMPVMDGREMVERLLVLRPDVRVLFVSGYTDADILRRGLVQAQAEFLQKPFTPELLARRVREQLDAPVPQRLGGKPLAAG